MQPHSLSYFLSKVTHTGQCCRRWQYGRANTFAYSVEKVALKLLDDAYAGLIAKRLAAGGNKTSGLHPK